MTARIALLIPHNFNNCFNFDADIEGHEDIPVAKLL
jgi:hypothetical protein